MTLAKTYSSGGMKAERRLFLVLSLIALLEFVAILLLSSRRNGSDSLNGAGGVTFDVSACGAA
jgi:hypothetical protein